MKRKLLVFFLTIAVLNLGVISSGYAASFNSHSTNTQELSALPLNDVCFNKALVGDNTKQCDSKALTVGKFSSSPLVWLYSIAVIVFMGAVSLAP